MKGNTMPDESPQDAENPQSSERRILDSLKFGVEGHRPENNSERAVEAAKIVGAFAVVEEAAFKAAGPFQEPNLIRPFTAEFVNEHGGDLVSVMADPNFQDFIVDSLNLNAYEQLSFDEDGEHSQHIFPMDDPDNQALVSTTRTNVSGEICAEKAASLAQETTDRITAHREGAERLMTEFLTFGVESQGPAANAERAERASRHSASFSAEESLEKGPLPFADSGLADDIMAEAVVKHGGDLAAVLADPVFEDVLIAGFDLYPYDVPVVDADGINAMMVHPIDDEANRVLMATMTENVTSNVMTAPYSATGPAGSKPSASTQAVAAVHLKHHQVVAVDQVKPGQILVNGDGSRARVDSIIRDGEKFQLHLTGEQNQKGIVNALPDKQFKAETGTGNSPARPEYEVPDMTAINHQASDLGGPDVA